MISRVINMWFTAILVTNSQCECKVILSNLLAPSVSKLYLFSGLILASPLLNVACNYVKMAGAQNDLFEVLAGCFHKL